MLLSTSLIKMETYQATVEDLTGEFKMDVKLTKVNKGELLSSDNPRYQALISKYPHLKEVKMSDHDIRSHNYLYILCLGQENMQE